MAKSWETLREWSSRRVVAAVPGRVEHDVVGLEHDALVRRLRVVQVLEAQESATGKRALLVHGGGSGIGLGVFASRAPAIYQPCAATRRTFSARVPADGPVPGTPR